MDDLTEIKALLRGAYRAHQLYNTHLECLYKLRSVAEGVGAMDYGRVRVSGGDDVPALESAALRLVDYERVVAADLDNLRCKFDIAHRVIMGVPSPVQQTLLVKRYLSYERWESIACEMKYSWAQIHRLHHKSLLAANAAWQKKMR